MAIAPATTETIYALAGSTVGPFATIWPYAEASDVQVFLNDGTGWAQLTAPTDFTLVGPTPLINGGNVTLDGILAGAGWAAGASVALARSTADGQPSVFGEVTGFSPKASEAALDNVARQVQELATNGRRALQFPLGEGALELPTLADRASRWAMWDLFGRLVGAAGALNPTLVPVAAYGARLLAISDIATRINLYVALGGNDANDGLTAGTAVATINHAFALTMMLGGLGRWKINVAAGHYAHTQATLPRHGADVELAGSFTQTTLTAASRAGGADGAYSLSYALAPGHGAQVGDWLLVRNAVGTGGWELLCGAVRVTAVAGNAVTALSAATLTGYTGAYPAAALTAGDVYVLHSVLNTVDQDGLRLYSDLSADGLMIVGNSNANTYGVILGRENVDGDDVTARCTFTCGLALGLANFGVNLHVQTNSKASVLGICLTGGVIYNGLAQHGGSIFGILGISTGAHSESWSATNSGDLWLENSINAGNFDAAVYVLAGGSALVKLSRNRYNGYGIICERGGSARGGSGAVFSNNNIGVRALGGNMYMLGDTALNNITADIQADSHGRIEANGASAAAITADEHSYIDARDMPLAVTVYCGVMSEINVGNTTVTGSTPAVKTFGLANTPNAGGYVRKDT